MNDDTILPVQVILAALELCNTLVTNSPAVLVATFRVGMVPVVARFASQAYPRSIRMQAAAFLQQMCLTNQTTAQMFVACQVGQHVHHVALYCQAQ